MESNQKITRRLIAGAILVVAVMMITSDCRSNIGCGGYDDHIWNIQRRSIHRTE